MAKETRALRKPVPLSVPELKVSSLRKRSVNHKIMAFLGGRLRKKNFLNAKTDQHQFSPNTLNILTSSGEEVRRFNKMITAKEEML